MNINITDKPDETVQLCIDCTYSELSDIQWLLETAYEQFHFPVPPEEFNISPGDIQELMAICSSLAKAIDEHFNKED